MKFQVTLAPGEDGYVVVECPSIPGCISQGKTRDEAIRNITEAIAGCLEVRAEKGMPLMLDTCEVDVELPTAPAR